MRKKRKLFFGIGVVFLAFCLFMVWYKITYSMAKVEPYTVNSASLPIKVLIATQGSDYKNAVVNGVIYEIKRIPAFINVIDVTSLKSIEVEEWDAVLILHTWEVWQPQEDAAVFLEKHYSPDRIVVHCTSGSGEEMIQGVDAISGASVMDKVPQRVDEIVGRLNAVIDKE